MEWKSGPDLAGEPVFDLEALKRTRLSSRELGSQAVRYLELGGPPMGRKKPEAVDEDLDSAVGWSVPSTEPGRNGTSQLSLTGYDSRDRVGRVISSAAMPALLFPNTTTTSVHSSATQWPASKVSISFGRSFPQDTHFVIEF